MTTTPGAGDGPPRRRRREASQEGHGATYGERLPPDLKEALQQARSDLDIADEIKLMRVVLVRLAEDLPDSANTMKEVASVLGRLIYIQARTLGGQSDLEQVLMDAADLALDHLALEHG